VCSSCCWRLRTRSRRRLCRQLSEIATWHTRARIAFPFSHFCERCASAEQIRHMLGLRRDFQPNVTLRPAMGASKSSRNNPESDLEPAHGASDIANGCRARRCGETHAGSCLERCCSRCEQVSISRLGDLAAVPSAATITARPQWWTSWSVAWRIAEELPAESASSSSVLGSTIESDGSRELRPLR